MNRKTPLLLLSLAAAVAIPGHASANTSFPDADCSGFKFEMPATEDGTTIVVTRNGVEEYRTRNDVFGTRYSFTIASPDQSVTQVWRVAVSGFNGTTNWTEAVAPCVAPTTTSTTTTTVVATTPPVPTTVPPAVSSTVVTTPRTPATTEPAPATTVPLVGELPETGWATDLPLFLGAFLVGVGISARTLARRK